MGLLADLPDEMPEVEESPAGVDLHRKGKRHTLGKAAYRGRSFGALPMQDRNKRFVPDWATDPTLLPKKPPGRG